MAKYLDENGLSTLWGRIKTLHGTSSGGTTTIDYTINGKAISSNPVLIGTDIATSYSDKTTLADKFSQYLPLAGGTVNGTVIFRGTSTNLGIDYYRIFKSVNGSTYSYSFPTASGMLVVNSQLATINGKSLLNDGANITIDSNLFVIVESLDSVTTPDSNKIYLVPKTSTSGSTTYVQYMYVDDSWKELGEDTVSVDLSDYVTKEGLSKAVHEISNLSATVGTQVATIEIQTVDYNAVTGATGVNTKSCSIPAASTSKAGMMTAVDKTNLNSAYNNIILGSTTSGDITVYTLTPFTANGPYTSKIISFSVPVVTAITTAEIDEVCV